MQNPFENKIHSTPSAETGLRFDMSDRPRMEREYWDHLMKQLAIFDCDINSAVAKAEEFKAKNDQVFLDNLFKVLKAINEYTKNRKVADSFADEYNEKMNEIVEVEGKKMHRFEAEALRDIVEEINQMYAEQRKNDSEFEIKDVDLRQIVEKITVNEKNGVRFVYLGRMNLTKIPKAIGLLVNLRILDLAGNQISEISGLETLINLQELWLNGNQIREINGLETLINLQELSLANNQIIEIKGLDKLVNLLILELNNNQISEIKGLNKLVNLQQLWLSSNQISEIKGLESLMNLKDLRLDGNQISEIKGLDALVNLEKLQLWKNQISKIQGLGALVNLHDLDLSANQISEINGLDALVNLYQLQLDNNQISVIEGLTALVNLKSLSLRANKAHEVNNHSQLQELFERGVRVDLLL